MAALNKEPYISPQDRDYAVRTIIGEASNQDDEGMAAVGHVIMNRARSGKHGASLRDVVLAPRQFEPWDTRRDELLGYAPDSPEYIRAAKVLDGVLAKDAADPTGGATHFLNERIVRERTGGKLPKWASGEGKRIGDHTFYGGQPTQVAAAGDLDGLFDEYSRNKPAPPASATVKVVNPQDDVFAEFSRPASMTGAEVKPVPRSDDENVSFGGRAVLNAPVVGPIIKKGVAALGAVLPGGTKNSQPTFRERYDANMGELDRMDRGYAENHPLGALGADLTGGFAVLGPLSNTRLGARAMGMSGTSLGSRAYQGAAGMGGIQTAHELLKGENPAAQGFFGPVPLAVAGGFAGPVVGEGVARAYQGVKNLRMPTSGPLKGTNSITRNKLVESVGDETPASIAEAEQSYGRAGIMGDLNQATRDITGGLADIPGAAKGEIREALRVRSAEQAPRLQASLNANMGPHQNIQQLTRSIEDTRDAAAKPLYDAFRSTKIQPTPAIKELIPRLEAAGAFKMADELAGISGRDTTQKFFTTGPQKDYPTAETWDYVKRGLDRRISAAYDSGDKNLARELNKLKKDVLTEVEKTPGGKIWKEARETFAEGAEVVHQLEEGAKTWSRATRVDELAHDLVNLSAPERKARIQGARDAVQEIIVNSVRGDTTARNTLLTPAGRDKMELLFGKQKAAALVRDLEAELNISRSTNEMIGGSPTAAKQARRNELLPEAAEKGYLRSIDLTRPATMVPDWMTPQAIMEGAAQARHATSREQLGRFMQVRMGSPEFRELVAELAAEGSRAAATGQAAGRLGRVVTGGTAATSPTLRNRLLAPGDQERGSAGEQR